MAFISHPQPVLPPPPGSLQPETSLDPVRTGRTIRMLCAAGAVAVTGGVTAYLFAFNPNLASSVYPQCVLKAATGVDCPGCGGLRGTYALLNGDLAGAADHNILVFAVVPLLVYFVVRFVLEQFEVTLPAPRMRPWMAYVSVAFLAFFTVARNIGGSPFAYFNSGWA